MKANNTKMPRILFFVKGVAPTPADLDAAAELSSVQVSFRNASAVPATGSVEDCEGVAGAVPPQYQHFPSPEEAVKTYKAALKKRAAVVGDSPAPGPLSVGTSPGTAPAAASDDAQGKGGTAGAGEEPPKVDAPPQTPPQGAAWSSAT